MTTHIKNNTTLGKSENLENLVKSKKQLRNDLSFVFNVKNVKL